MAVKVGLGVSSGLDRWPAEDGGRAAGAARHHTAAMS